MVALNELVRCQVAFSVWSSRCLWKFLVGIFGFLLSVGLNGVYLMNLYNSRNCNYLNQACIEIVRMVSILKRCSLFKYSLMTYTQRFILIALAVWSEPVIDRKPLLILSKAVSCEIAIMKTWIFCNIKFYNINFQAGKSGSTRMVESSSSITTPGRHRFEGRACCTI